MVYFVLFESTVSYALLFWEHSCHTHRIIVLQKRTIKIILGMACCADVGKVFIERRILTVLSLYTYKCSSFVFLRVNSVYSFFLERKKYTLLTLCLLSNVVSEAVLRMCTLQDILRCFKYVRNGTPILEQNRNKSQVKVGYSLLVFAHCACAKACLVGRGAMS